MLGSADYTASNGLTVVLASGATAGDLVEVISFSVSSVLNAIPGTAGSVGTTYLADSSVTTAKIAAGAIVQADLATGVAGTGPAFAAYRSSPQSVSTGTWTKVQFQTELFDTAGSFDNTTNYRFQPLLAGYYQVNSAVTYGLSSSWTTSSIRKNGTGFVYGTSVNGSPNGQTSTASSVVYLNGSTDYLEVFSYQGSGSTQSISDGVEYTWFNAALVRAA
jgi:hypothetical protein